MNRYIDELIKKTGKSKDTILKVWAMAQRISKDLEQEKNEPYILATAKVILGLKEQSEYEKSDNKLLCSIFENGCYKTFNSMMEALGYQQVDEELTSQSIPQNSRPEQNKETVVIRSMPKDRVTKDGRGIKVKK